MARVVIDRRNTALEYATDCIIVRTQNEAPRSLPLKHLTQLVCMHNVVLSTQLIGQLKRRGIDLVVLNQRYHQNSFALFADETLMLKRRCLQYELQKRADLRLPFIRAICRNKFSHIQRMLNTHFAEHGQLTKHAFSALANLALTEQQIRGVEGALQQQVFAVLRQTLSPALGFTQRNRRPPRDPVNSILSLSYMMVHNAAVRQATAAGLDSRLGFYHRIAHARHSLACDMMEPVRPKVDAWTSQLFLEGILHRRDFSTTAEGCFIGKSGRLRFYAAIEEQLPDWERQLNAGYRWLTKKIDAVAAQAGVMLDD